MNTPVSFELAKLLKEKEFNEPSYSFYITDKSEYGEIGEFIINPNDNYPELDDNTLFDTLASAPTIADVVMWLYEKHDIWIYVNIFQTTTQYYCQAFIQIEGNEDYCIKTGKFPHTPTAFNSPTEAYLAAIGYTLKNLI